MEVYILMVVIGVALFVLGFTIGRLSKRFKGKMIGEFIINRSDPTKPAFWLDLDNDLDVIEKQDAIGFTVVINDDNANVSPKPFNLH